MSGCVLIRLMLLKCLLLLCLSGCQGQKDCTGVDCLVLENCIEESLANGACCATCAQKGCTCQGYQYYDCVNAGYRNGKVPEGESYFVDFGSTECSCPTGGGRISCHFIPCPDIPANCIELSEPADGCIQCKRIGCVHNEQRYEAGHSFHMDPCQVCHCPNDGGSLMCYPIPDCDPRKVEKPMLATTTEENAHHNKNPLQFIFQHQGPREHLSKPLRPAHGDTLPLLPLFTQHPSNPEDEEEEEMDYDYLPMDTPGPLLQDLAAPTESSIISVSYPESFTARGPSLYRNGKQELRETFGIHHEVAAHMETTQAPATTFQHTTPRHQTVTTSSWQRAFENQVLPLETSHAADHDDDARVTDADEDEVEGKEEERLAPSHDFTVFPHRGKHAPFFVDHRHDGTQTPSRPVVPGHGLNRNTHSRPKTVEVDQDRSTMTNHGHDRHTQIKPVMSEMDRNRSIFADHERNRNTQSKPVLKELDQDRGTSTDQSLSKVTQSRPVIPEVGSFADHGLNRNTHSRPKTVEVDQDRSTTMTDRGYDRHTQTRPVIAEMDRNRSSFADHGRNKNTQSRPVLKELEEDRGTSTDQSLSKVTLNRNTHSRPVMGEVDHDSGLITDDSQSRNTQRWPIMEEHDIGARHRGTLPQHGHGEETETRSATAEIDRDKGSFPQNRPVLEELDLHRVTSPQQGHSQTPQSRPNTEKFDLHKTTQTRPRVPEIDSDKGSFPGHGLNRSSQSQPVTEELDRVGGTFIEHGPGRTSQPILEIADHDSSTFPEPAQREILHTRPAMAETDRDKGSFADHVRNRNPQSSPVIEEFDGDRGRFTGQGHSKPAQTRPVTEEVDPDKGTGRQPWSPSMEQIVRQPVRLQENHITPPVPPVLVNFAERTTHRPPPQQRFHQIHTLFPTTQPPLRVRADGGFSVRNQTQAFTDTERERERERVEERDNSLSSLPVDNRGAVTMRQVERCCEVGKKWAAEYYHCNHMPAMPDDNNILCSVVQEQCCTGALRLSRCLAGMSAARGGDACQAPPDGRLCGEDSYQECCSCCSLGLQLREAGLGCHAHQHLDYPCGHILLTCCEEVEDNEEAAFGGYAPDGPELRRKEMPRPTTTPKKVSDRRPLKEAFSVGDGEDAAANSLEETGGVMDSCQKFAGRLCHHICINTWGSYHCQCHSGHVLLQDGHTCAPEDSEEDNRVREEERPVTQATSRLTTFTASSPSSTTTTTTTTTTQIPVLLNPCAGNGPCAQRCSVAGGRAKCSCFPGFSLMADGHSCEDVDECITNTHTCKPTERCLNTVGAFMCEKQISCSSGYQLRNGVCEDIDECVTRTHNCGATMECRNTEGSFSCVPKQQRCYTGFTQDTHGNCIDIDECTSLAEPCSSGFNCINTVGSYTCQRKVIMCSTGYHASPDGARCIDVDECQTGIHRCGEGQICQNVPGSYRCNCQTGYQYDAIRQTCVDVNECWRYPGRLCAQTCENTPGSYQCSCTAGFSLAFDGKNCEDVNECDRNPCSQECANIYGSYQCYCRQGFYLKEDGHTCEDIDECSQSIGHLCAFQCVNIPGSYQCACPPTGYSMSPNGRTCRDIDECAIGSHNCSLSESCFNIQGGFRCLSFACPSNYRKVSDTRCERVSCLNVQDCQSSPLRITYYQLSFQTNIIIPAQIFRIGPSPAYAGDSIMIGITRGNKEGYFSTRRLNSFTGAVYLQRQVREPRDFLIDVEMKLLRQGTFTTFLARIYVFITANAT